MEDDQTWHLFDELHGLEVMRLGQTYSVRRVGSPEIIAVMDRENWDKVRAGELRLVTSDGD